MPLASAYHLIEGVEITGPHSHAVLRQKAEIYVLKPDTLARPADAPASEPWRPLREHPELFAAVFPQAGSRPAHALGSARFESVTAATDAAAPATDVLQLLRDNAAVERGQPRNAPLPPPPPASAYRYRRKRDYLICAGLLNALCAALLVTAGLGNPILFTYTVALFAIGNIALVWVMFFVMDRY